MKFNSFKRNNKIPASELTESANPLYNDSLSRMVGNLNLQAPSWFSSRAGSHFDRVETILFDLPMYGLQICTSTSGDWKTDDLLLVAPLYCPQDFVYTNKIKVPPWLLFASSPYVNGFIVKNEDSSHSFEVESKDLSALITHYQKTLRDPSLDVFQAMISSGKILSFKLHSSRMHGLDATMKFGKQEASAKFNPWARLQMKTIDLQ